MNIIAWIGSLISVLKYAPQILALVREVIGLINSLKSQGIDSAFTPKLRDAIKEIREKRDTSKLEDLHKELTSLCGPLGCKL